MRLRNVKGSREAIQESIYVVHEEETRAGSWHDIFGNDHPIHIEIGMGKGRFLMELAAKNPDINYVGIEKYSSVLIRALEKMSEMETPLANIRFVRMDAEAITKVFAAGEVERIYLNFSDPWPKDRHAKRRLTSKEFFGKIQCDPESRWQSGIQDGQPSPVRFLSGICEGSWLEAGCGNLRSSS